MARSIEGEVELDIEEEKDDNARVRAVGVRWPWREYGFAFVDRTLGRTWHSRENNDANRNNVIAHSVEIVHACTGCKIDNKMRRLVCCNIVLDDSH